VSWKKKSKRRYRYYEDKLMNAFNKLRYQCKKCGHKSTIPTNSDKGVCYWCGRYIFRNEKDEFKYRFNSIKKRKDDE